MTATNNNSLTGVTVKNVEKVYVTGANFQTSGTTGAALATATAAKAATAASLTAAQASIVTAQSQDNAADAIVSQGPVEDVVVQLATATVASAASQTAAATVVSTVADATILAQVFTAADIKSAYTALSTAQKAAFTEAEYGAALKAASTSTAGVTLAAGDVTARKAAVLADKVAAEEAVKASQQDLATAIQQQSAAIAVNATADATIVANALLTGTALTTAYKLLTADQQASFSEAQWKAATVAAATGEDGTTLLAAGVTAEKLAEKNAADSLVAFEGGGDYTLAQLNAAATAALKSSVGTTLITNGNDGVNINARAVALATASAAVVTAAGTEAAKAVVADNTAASALAVATTAAAAVADASLSGASFAGSTEVWLKGANSNKTDLTVTTQTAGLSGVTGLDNKVTFGATGTLAVAGSTGTVDIGGAAGGLTIGGSSGTLTLTNTGGTTAAKAVKALTISTSGAMAADVAGLAQLTTVTSNGAGGATVSGSGAKLATIATGEGADSVKVATTTVKDNTTTTALDETVNADVSTGAGNDTVNLATTGAGTTTVATGEGNDNVYVQGISSGVGTVTTGAGNDTVNLNVTLAANPSMAINAGDGVDSLITAGGTLTAVDYLRMNTALSGFETVTFTGDTTVDVSKLAIGSVAALTFANAGASVATEVGAQSLVLAPLAAVTASTNGITPVRSLETGAVGFTASAAGYVAATAATAAAYGGSLNITSASFTATTLEANATTATVTVAAIGAATAAASNAETVNLATSDIQGLVVNLASARGTAAATAATEFQATFNAGTIINTAAAINEHLEALSSVKVNGAGVFTINTGTVTAALAKLTSIDVSGMIATANLDATGVEADTTNASTTSITLNDLVKETVTLGGARDTIATDSTVSAMDTITGFQLTASTASALVADTTRSDVLNLTTATAFLKFTSTSATTFAGMLTEAGAATAGGAPTDNLVFHFGGDTYAYVDTGADGLTDNDILVKLTGTLDLDQLTTAGVIA